MIGKGRREIKSRKCFILRELNLKCIKHTEKRSGEKAGGIGESQDSTDLRVLTPLTTPTIGKEFGEIERVE